MSAYKDAPFSWQIGSRFTRTAIVRASAAVRLLTGPLLQRFMHRKEGVTPLYDIVPRYPLSLRSSASTPSNTRP